MGRKRVYIRVWRGGPTADDQRATLRESGINIDDPDVAVYTDELKPSQERLGAVALKDRDVCIRDMRLRPDGEGSDELVVCAPWVLAISPGDFFSVAAKLAEKGAIIHDLTSGKRLHWIPEMAGMADMAASISRFQGRRKTEKARLTVAMKDVKTGPKPKLSGRLLDLFLIDWGDAAAGTNKEVAARHGIGVQTAHRVAGMSRSEAIRRAERAKYGRMEAETPIKAGRRKKPTKSQQST